MDNLFNNLPSTEPKSKRSIQVIKFELKKLLEDKKNKAWIRYNECTSASKKARAKLNRKIKELTKELEKN